MTDDCEEKDDQWLISRKVHSLFGLDSKHELLKYAINADDDSIWEEFFGRFGRTGTSRTEPSDQDMMHANAAYYLALCDACEELERTVLANRQPVHSAAAMTAAANHRRHSIRDEDVPF